LFAEYDDEDSETCAEPGEGGITVTLSWELAVECIVPKEDLLVHPAALIAMIGGLSALALLGVVGLDGAFCDKTSGDGAEDVLRDLWELLSEASDPLRGCDVGEPALTNFDRNPGAISLFYPCPLSPFLGGY
jgi:hypothetical protein